jgi:hypothetical protein
MKSVEGVFVTPILATFVATLIMCIISHEVSSTQFIGVLFTYTFVGSIFAVISALLFGWPLSLIYRRFRFVKWWQFSIGGAICAFPFWVAWFYPFNSTHWEMHRVGSSAYFYGVGIISGYFYWHFVVRAKPTNISVKSDT